MVLQIIEANLIFKFFVYLLFHPRHKTLATAPSRTQGPKMKKRSLLVLPSGDHEVSCKPSARDMSRDENCLATKLNSSQVCEIDWTSASGNVDEHVNCVSDVPKSRDRPDWRQSRQSTFSVANKNLQWTLRLIEWSVSHSHGRSGEVRSRGNPPNVFIFVNLQGPTSARQGLKLGYSGVVHCDA